MNSSTSNSKHANQNTHTAASNTVFVVDVLDASAPTNKTGKTLTELSCGHIIEGKINLGNKCPVCNKRVCENATLKKRKLIFRIVLAGLVVLALILAFSLLRPISFSDIAGGKIENVREDQKEQLNSYTSINYHTPGFTWAKVSLSGKFYPYTPETFSLKPGATQAFYDKDNNLLFAVITTDDLEGCIAYVDADNTSQATLYGIY